MFPTILPVALFLLAVSFDSLTAGLAYGSTRVHIKPVAGIFLVCIPSASIALMTKIGSFLFAAIPDFALSILSFLLLFILGIEKLMESLIRYLADKYPVKVGNWACRIRQMNIIFTIYFSPEDANTQDTQVLSGKEAFFLSLALSLDSILTSMAFSGRLPSMLILFFLAALFHFLLFLAGFVFGLILARKCSLDLSWLSGLFLLLLALCALV